MRARRPSYAALVVWVATALLFADACRQSEPLRDSGVPASVSRYETAHAALSHLQERFVPVGKANRKSFRGRSGEVSGFGAGAHYPQIWLRDSATLLPVTRFFYERELLTSWIEEHKLELRLEANVSLDSLGVALPRGTRALEVLFAGAPVPFELETIGEDNYAIYAPDKVSGRNR